jgi:PAS domain S-box-containing protein
MSSQEPVRALIVEDEDVAANMIEKLLKGTAFEVVGKATTGSEEADGTQSTHLDVVLMDLTTPGVDGIEDTRRIQERCPTPVLMLTACEAPELVEKASEAGVGAYLVKPANGHELERAITATRARFDDVQAIHRLNADLQVEITERVQTEKALRESEDRFRLLIQEIPVLINAMGEGNVFLFWNRECEKVTGYSADEITGNPQAIELLHPDTSCSHQLLAGRAERGSAFRNGEVVLTCKDGSQKTISWSDTSDQFPVPGWKSWAIGVDVTPRKHAENALEQHVARLALLNNIGPKIAAVLDPDEMLNRAAQLAQESFGYHHVAIFTLDRAQGELELRTKAGAFAHLFPPDHWLKLSEGMIGWVARHGETLLANNVDAEPNHVNFFSSALPTRSELSVPIRMREMTIGVLDVQSPQLNAFDENDAMVLEALADQIAVTLENASLHESLQRELAERKQAEAALQESQLQVESRERFINRIVECIPSSLVVFDRTLRIVSVNHNFLEKARRKESEIVGRRIEEGFPHVLMEYTRLGESVKEVFRSGQPLEGGKVSYRAPGLPTRIYYYRLIPLKASGMVENVMLLMDDITERERLGEEVRRAERHLAGVVECANDLVVSMDPQGQIVTWNQAAERASGIRAEQVKGQSLLSLCDPEQEPEMADLLQQLIRGKGVQTTEVDLLAADGQAVPIAWSCSPMWDDAGAVMGIVAVGRDLTERHQLEAQLIQSAKIASLGVMAGGIAHELRNPLGVISAAAQLLLDRPDGALLRNEAAQKIHAASQRASLIIENLLKFARPQSERMREVDLHALLDETLDLLAHQMALQTIVVKKEFQPNLPKITGNPTLLQQVFTNLILNARNAMAEGGRLTVTTRADDTGQVETKFDDTGRGIPAEHLSRIFDPFFTTMPVGQGIGLGLSISYSIIQQHQGTLEVESRAGKGTTFTIRLPADR